MVIRTWNTSKKTLNLFLLLDQIREFEMPTSMRNILEMSWKWIRTSSIGGLLKPLNATELTKLSWATCIKSYAEVPDVYKSFFEPILAEGRAFPYTILTPSYERFVHKTTEKIISDFGHDIYVLERNRDSFETQCYPVDKIIYIEFETALLASSFKICGKTDQGGYASSTLKFNTVTDYMFTPILKRARKVSVDSKNVALDTEMEKFNCLADVNFKFMNLAKHSLLEGEKVIQFIFQHDIQERLLSILKINYYRTISATQMIILTDKELITIREDATQRKEDRYGGFWVYIPINKFNSLFVSEKYSDLLLLTIQLPIDISFELLFQISARKELNQLLRRFKELAAA